MAEDGSLSGCSLLLALCRPMLESRELTEEGTGEHLLLFILLCFVFSSTGVQLHTAGELELRNRAR